MSAAQVALAWLLAQGPDIVPIPGTKRRETMEDSVLAADLELDEAELAALDAVRRKARRLGRDMAKWECGWCESSITVFGSGGFP